MITGALGRGPAQQGAAADGEEKAVVVGRQSSRFQNSCVTPSTCTATRSAIDSGKTAVSPGVDLVAGISLSA